MTLDRYFGSTRPDFYRQVHADCGVETAQYLDDLYGCMRLGHTLAAQWSEVYDFYFAHGCSVVPQQIPVRDTLDHG